MSLVEQCSKSTVRVAAVQSRASTSTCKAPSTRPASSQEGIERMNLGDGKFYHISGSGCATIIALDGRKLTQDLGEEEEGLLVADLDLDKILKVKTTLDVRGHYSRPDLLRLGVDYREKKQVRPHGPELSEA